MVEKGLKTSDFVFYGKVIRADSSTQTYAFEVIELFKGKYSAKTLNGKEKNDCSVFPNQIGSLWLVYANFNDDKTISFTICNPSIAMDLKWNFPPRPNEKTKLGLTQDSLFIETCKNENLKNWIFQVDKLRKYKLAADVKTAKEKEKFFEGVIVISLIINIILFLSLIYVGRRKKLIGI